MTTTALGYVLGRLKLDTGNVWPAVALHIAWNTVIQASFDPATIGEDKGLSTGEAGASTVVALAAVAVFVSATYAADSVERCVQPVAGSAPTQASDFNDVGWLLCAVTGPRHGLATAASSRSTSRRRPSTAART